MTANEFSRDARKELFFVFHSYAFQESQKIQWLGNWEWEAPELVLFRDTATIGVR